MKHVVVRYTLKVERVVEHETLLQRVFDELSAKKPAGVVYEAWKLADGVTFMHIARVSAADNPLTSLDAFKKFTADIKGRCEVPPASSEGAPFGGYDGVAAAS